MNIRLIILLVLFVCICAILFFTIQKPTTDHLWIDEQVEQATAEVVGSTVTFTNLRDWTYDAEKPLTKDWITKSVDTDKIVKAWFILEPFSSWKAVGHTFLSFEFEDGTVLSFSVEARRDDGEEYSAIQGAFNKYELTYQWGTERDFISRRLIYLNHPVRLYPLSLTPEQSKAVFLSLVEETNELARKPRFYNTLTANCTNVLSQIINRHYPASLPFDASWYLTGYSDTYLMKEGFIPLRGTIAETQTTQDLTPFREQVASFTTTSPVEFSASLRKLIGE